MHSVPMVYIAIVVCLVAVVVRMIKVGRSPAPFQLAIYPAADRPLLAALGDALGMKQIRKRKPVFWFFLMVFHIGLILLALGHLDILPQMNIVPQSRGTCLARGQWASW